MKYYGFYLMVCSFIAFCLYGIDKWKAQSGGWRISEKTLLGISLIGGGVAVVLIVLHSNKKAKEREAEATVNAYKRKKIDTTDDLSIDVYADEEVEETTAETVEEVTETEAEPTQAEEVKVEETDEVKDE